MDDQATSLSRAGIAHKAEVPRTAAPTPKPQPCDSCAGDAFLQWQEAQLEPSFNVEVTFSPPQGQRLVVEFVTATVEVPAGESARLRMFTGFSNSQAGNFDLALTPQGIVNGQSVYVATHTLRAYTDNHIDFNINRDNAITKGSALICISGYIVV